MLHLSLLYKRYCLCSIRKQASIQVPTSSVATCCVLVSRSAVYCSVGQSFDCFLLFELLPFATKIEIWLFVTELVLRTACTLVLAVSSYLNNVVSHLPWPTLFVIRKTSVLHLNKLSSPLENQNVDVKVDLSLTGLNKSLFNYVFLSRDLVERRSRF